MMEDCKQPDMLPDYPTPPSSHGDALSSAGSCDDSFPGSPDMLDDSRGKYAWIVNLKMLFRGLNPSKWNFDLYSTSEQNNWFWNFHDAEM